VAPGRKVVGKRKRHSTPDDDEGNEAARKVAKRRQTKRSYCSADGCTNKVQQGGVCRRHGAKLTGRNCSHEGCSNHVVNGGVCIKHGATCTKKKCSIVGCKKYAQNGGVCVRHGEMDKEEVQQRRLHKQSRQGRSVH